MAATTSAVPNIATSAPEAEAANEAGATSAVQAEDDEFEDFPVDDWDSNNEGQNLHLWDETWDDQVPEGNFSNVLEAELANIRSKTSS